MKNLQWKIGLIILSFEQKYIQPSLFNDAQSKYIMKGGKLDTVDVRNLNVRISAI